MSASKVAAAFVGLLLLGSALVLTKGGSYGLTLFLALPVVVGALGETVACSRSDGKAALAGMKAVLIGSLLFLALGLEGVICIIMTIPLAPIAVAFFTTDNSNRIRILFTSVFK